MRLREEVHELNTSANSGWVKGPGTLSRKDFLQLKEMGYLGDKIIRISRQGKKIIAYPPSDQLKP